MNHEFKNAKEAYDATPIPPELEARVQQGIRQGKALYKSRKNRAFRRLAATAACFILVLAGLNLSPALAHAASNVPVLGGLFRMLTVTNYNTSEDGIN